MTWAPCRVSRPLVVKNVVLCLSCVVLGGTTVIAGRTIVLKGVIVVV